VKSIDQHLPTACGRRCGKRSARQSLTPPATDLQASFVVDAIDALVIRHDLVAARERVQATIAPPRAHRGVVKLRKQRRVVDAPAPRVSPRWA
jgi:hypothetical protein